MSTSLTLNARPTQQGQFESLQRELFERNRQLNEAEQSILDLENQLRTEKLKVTQIERGVGALRAILTPLHGALRMVFGEIDTMGVASDNPAPAGTPKNSVVWESWKQRMGPNSAAAKIIDILMVHGKLNNTQIRIHLGTSRMQTVYDAISKLNKASLLNKNGDEFSLKEL